MDLLYTLKLDNGSMLDVKADSAMGLALHDLCVFRRDFYMDMGEVVREVALPPANVNWRDLPIVQHIAGPAELSAANENYTRSREAMQTARQLVDKLGLEMKLLNAHFSLDGKMVLIQFSADGRIDFRELVKELSRSLCTRIELRQIGVRDETGIHGGIGVCGQKLCCCRFLKEFNSINVKMAKEQDLSLTPATISGACGRLKCCLKFEHEGYQELEKMMPKRGNWCETPQGRGRICDRNLLTLRVSVQLESGNVVQFGREDIEVQSGESRPPRPSGDERSGERSGERPSRSGEYPSREGGRDGERRDRRNGGERGERRPSENAASRGGRNENGRNGSPGAESGARRGPRPPSESREGNRNQGNQRNQNSRRNRDSQTGAPENAGDAREN